MESTGQPYGAIGNGAVGCRGGRIAFVGPDADASGHDAAEVIDCEGRWITPGLIDCHTHLVYGGDRAAEFELRLEGASYEKIARAGGGILSTVTATRNADEEALVRASLPRLDALLAEGVTTVEIKSGYGLETAAEIRQLRAARRLGYERQVGIETTFLGAHAKPPEFADTGAISTTSSMRCCPPSTPKVWPTRSMPSARASPSLPRRSSGCSRRRVASACRSSCTRNSFPPCSATLAAKFGALSADHVEYADASDVAAMAKSGTVATLLPGAFYTLRAKPPVDLFRGQCADGDRDRCQPRHLA